MFYSGVSANNLSKQPVQMKKQHLLSLGLALALSAGQVHAQDSSALVDALVRKKILTAQEGEDVRADLIRENAITNAGKLQISNSVTSLKLYGDVRLRYQADNKDPQIETPLAGSNYLFSTTDASLISGGTAYYSKNDGATKFTSTPWAVDSKGYAVTGSDIFDKNKNLVYAKGSRLVDSKGHYVRGAVNPATVGVGSPQHGTQTSRERIRLRLNGDFELAGGFFGGVQLQTGQSSDSGNQTLGDSASGASGFGNYNIYISRAFIGWGNDWLTLVGGKQPNPFYTTDLVWGPDINPDGFVEKVDLLALFNSLGKDDSAAKPSSPFDLNLRAGQFVFSDNAEDSFGADYNTDAWLFVTQLVGSAKITKGIKVTLAPGFLTYTAGNVGAANNTVSFTGGVPQYQYSAQSQTVPVYTQAATRDLAVITAPGDLSFKLLGLKTKVLWDFAYNTQGKARVENLYGLQNIQIPDLIDAKGNVTRYKNKHGVVDSKTLVSTTRVSGHSSQDDLAWLLGVQIGENKKAGDWSLLANFRQTGLGAVDPNLNDPNFALGYLNTQGIKAGLAYNVNDFIVGAITYYNAWNLRNDLVGGQATGGQKIAAITAAEVFQVDLNIKF